MRYKIKSTAVIHELLNDEVILANLDTGVYYSIRGTGVPIWQLLILGKNRDFIAAQFLEKYKTESTLQLGSFVDQLVEEELLVLESDDREIGTAPLQEFRWPNSFSAPLLEKYEEMKSLLMLDPIHEVDEQGWPAKPN
jgi:hypothetical protein